MTSTLCALLGMESRTVLIRDASVRTSVVSRVRWTSSMAAARLGAAACTSTAEKHTAKFDLEMI